MSVPGIIFEVLAPGSSTTSDTSKPPPRLNLGWTHDTYTYIAAQTDLSLTKPFRGKTAQNELKFTSKNQHAKSAFFIVDFHLLLDKITKNASFFKIFSISVKSVPEMTRL